MLTGINNIHLLIKGCGLYTCSSSLAGPLFEKRGGERLSQQLAEQLEEAYSSPNCLDRKSLSVVSGDQCWVIYVDALVMTLTQYAHMAGRH